MGGGFDAGTGMSQFGGLLGSLCQLLINFAKLPGPPRPVQERPEVEAVVVWSVVLAMVRRGENGSFVAVDGVPHEELLHLGCCLLGSHAVTPEQLHPPEHADRPTLEDFAELAEHRQFLVRHAEVCFIGLLFLAILGRAKLCGGGCLEDGFQSLESKSLRRVSDKGPKVGLANASDRVYVCRRTVVLGEIPNKRLVNITRAQHEQRA
mmetsp:Transcript_29089/g.76209  ORF Transcript_29089/g.76209 Transcript_29089/m.76209 type:complete len:207 (+) Transcript_29089:2097-2717(+)